MKMRDETHIRYLREIEHAIRTSEFWRGKSKEAVSAIRRLYLTGSGECGGSTWPTSATTEDIAARIAAERKLEDQFAAIWNRDPELARKIDWRTFEIG